MVLRSSHRVSVLSLSATSAPLSTAGICFSSGSSEMASLVASSATHVTKTSDSSSLARSADQGMKNSAESFVFSVTTSAWTMPSSARKRGRLSLAV